MKNLAILSVGVAALLAGSPAVSFADPHSRPPAIELTALSTVAAPPGAATTRHPASRWRVCLCYSCRCGFSAMRRFATVISEPPMTRFDVAVSLA